MVRQTTLDVIFNAVKCTLSLDESILAIALKGTVKILKTIDVTSIIGCKTHNVSGQYILNIFSYPFKPLSLLTCCKKQKIEPETANGPKHYLVIVNPVSGQKKGLTIWKKCVKVMLDEAGITHDLLLTTHAHHATEHLQSSALALDQYSALVTIGGDGIVFEAVNGLLRRSEGVQALALPLAPIPGGSGNGLVKSILFEREHDYSVINAAFFAVRGRPAPLDLSLYHLAQPPPERPLYSYLQFSYGMIADVDIHTEPLRALGELRFTLGAVFFALRRRKYSGKLYLYTNGVESEEVPQSQITNNPFRTESHQPLSGPTDTIDTQPLLSNQNIPQPSHTGSISRISPDFLMPPLSQPIQAVPISSGISVSGSAAGSGWRVIESSFNLIWVLQTSHASASIYSSPTSSLADGVFTVLVCDTCSSLDLLQLLIMADTGEHIHHPKVRKFSATAFRFEPSNVLDGGIYSLDGEVVHYGPLQAQILPGAARVLCC